MTAITEDTPEGGPEELQWQIDGLTEMLKRANDELERERCSHIETKKDLVMERERSLYLTNRLTVGVLRDAGFTVEIKLPDVCDTCGE